MRRPSEPSSVRSDTRARTAALKSGGGVSKEVKKTVKFRGNRRVVMKGLRGKRGGSINLGRTNNRAWLGALIVGEGSIFNKPSKTRSPCLAIKMLDKAAIDKAAE